MHTPTTRPDRPADHVYVIQLSRRSGVELQGRLEHVGSGRRHDFDSGLSLLECLQQEEAQVARDLARELVRDPPRDPARGQGG